MSKSKLIKAIRATIQLGDMELDVFQLPDGSYGFSSTGIAAILGLSSHKRVGEILTSKALKPKTGIALGLGKTEDFRLDLAKVSTLDSGNINFLPLNLLMLIVGYEAYKNDNEFAQAILEASLTEAIERRADNAFGVLRTEQERNDRFQIRFDGILSRHFWTDSISEYIKTHPDLSENYKRWVFHNVSDTVNLALFGLTAKKVREHYQLENGMSVREMLNSRTLKLIDTIENAAATRVLETDSEPKQAIKDVIHLLGIEPSQDRL